MAKSLCRLVILVNHALVTNFDVANMSFNAIRENKVLAKISGFTVYLRKEYFILVSLIPKIVSVHLKC